MSPDVRRSGPAVAARLAVLALLGFVAAAALVALVPARPARAAPRWGWPLPPPHPVTRVFAPGPRPWSPGHRGVDLAAGPGTPVLAAGSGRVSFAGALAGRGVVVVDHGGLRTTYEPVSPSVAVGATVRTGDVLGTLDPGHEGCPAPACLHWGLLRGDTYLDPLRLVEAGPVRLLPLTDRLGAVPPAVGPAVAAEAGAAGRAGAPAAARPRATDPPVAPAGPAGPGPPAAVPVGLTVAALALTARSRRPGRGRGP